MAIMNYPRPPENSQPGEKLVFNRLKKHLPPNYYAWYEPTIQGKRRSVRPDFIVLGLDLGLAIIEVKDWSQWLGVSGSLYLRTGKFYSN